MYFQLNPQFCCTVVLIFLSNMIELSGQFALNFSYNTSIFTPLSKVVLVCSFRSEEAYLQHRIILLRFRKTDIKTVCFFVI